VVIEPDGDVVVIGVGNRYRSDDGIGHRVLDELAAELLVAESHPQPSRLTRVRLCWSDGEAARLIEEWRGAELAVVVDAVVAGDEPGTVRLFEAGVEDLPVRPGTSSHATGVGEAWALAGALDARPGRLVVVGVEPAVLDDGTELTPLVSAAVPSALRLVRTALAMASTLTTAQAHQPAVPGPPLNGPTTREVIQPP
jgi:hydrogenase maturation protease